MATTTIKAAVAFQAAQMRGNAGDPCSAGITRVIQNNLMHFADVFGQSRVKYVSENQATGLNIDDNLAGTNDNIYAPLMNAVVPCRVRADGSAYLFRVRIGGSNGASTNLATFRLGVGSPAQVSHDCRADTAPGNVISATTSSSTVAWLTGSATVVTVPTDQVLASIVEQPTIATVGGNAVISKWALLECQVWAKSADVSISNPELHGAICEEVCGT